MTTTKSDCGNSAPLGLKTAGLCLKGLDFTLPSICTEQTFPGSDVESVESGQILMVGEPKQVNPSTHTSPIYSCPPETAQHICTWMGK